MFYPWTLFNTFTQVESTPDYFHTVCNARRLLIFMQRSNRWLCLSIDFNCFVSVKNCFKMKSLGSLLTLNSNIKSSQCSSKFYLLHFLQVSKLFCEKLWAKIVFDRCNFVLRIQRFGYPVMLCLLSSTQFYLFLIYSLLYIYIVSKISYVLFFLSEFLGRAHLSCSESCIELTLINLFIRVTVSWRYHENLCHRPSMSGVPTADSSAICFSLPCYPLDLSFLHNDEILILPSTLLSRVPGVRALWTLHLT